MPHDCVEWTGPIDERGYGRRYFRGRPRVLAHRAAYAEVNGEIPDGMTVDHICFNPRCVNPDHLQLLTLDANRRRQRSAIKTHCVNGLPFDATNTYQRNSDRPRSGARDCKTCIRERARRYKAKKRNQS